MSTINVQLPGDLQEFVRDRLATGQFASESDYIIALVDAARRGQSSLEAALLAGVRSGPPQPWTDVDFERAKNRLAERHGTAER